MEISRATELERPEVLVPVSIRHIGILGLPFSQFEQVILGDLTFLCAVSQVSPLLPRKALPLDLRHSSTTQNQSTELIHHPFLILRIVVGEVLLQFPKEFPLSIGLIFEAKTH